ncbi:MAG: hypothetical protein HYV07_17085 [Deltaproteobacteria bacterium]|nr:hypothetical protein [Deltaproteobacteria bacterium]
MLRSTLLAAILLALGTAPGCGSECSDGDVRCSADGFELSACEDGAWKVTRCMSDLGQLCEAGECVDPWRYGHPSWPTCADEPHDAGVALSEKADRFDSLASRVFVHPELKWLMGSLRLAPGASEGNATYDDVEQWYSGENDGLWSALYLASQAFRYATTKDPDALAMIELLLEGEETRMDVTGVPGIFTRQYIPPGVSGISCPAGFAPYRPDIEKDDNKWVRIGDDGCAMVAETSTDAWKKTEHCISPDFAGYCWLDNVSKDEYSGHMFALGAVLKLVDDPAARATAADLLARVGRHFTSEGLRFRDWDGRVTEHGKLHPYTLDGFPGFHAAMDLAFVLMSAEASEDVGLRDIYDRCLLMSGGPVDCFDTGLIEVLPFLDHLATPGIYLGPKGCAGNWNNISMHLLSLHNLIWFERDPVRRGRIQRSLDVDVMRAEGEPRALIKQHNAFFDLIWAAQKQLGPESDGPAYDAVEDAVCMLRQFRPSEAVVDVPIAPEHNAPFCKDRFGDDAAEHAKEVYERCTTNFLWWADPYDINSCQAVEQTFAAPTDFLLPYWMGRYYGFIGADS